MSYNRIERSVAGILDSVPGLRKLAKAGYQRVNYLLHRRRNETVRLHPQARIDEVPGTADVIADHGDSSERFFGYYGMSPWSRDGHRYLFHQWLGQGRAVQICVYDRRTETSSSIGESHAWNFQQGSMAQWLQYQGNDAIAFNDVVDRRLVCRIGVLNGPERIIEWPVQAIHQDGTEGLSINYRRLAALRPEYGYDVDAQNFRSDQAPDRDGIWRVDLQSGGSELVVSLAQLMSIASRPEMPGADHKVNHALYSPSGRRFVFMHRWLGPSGKFSRLYCAESGGAGLKLLLDHRMVSHYAWRDDNTLLAWARTAQHGDRYYLIDVSTDSREVCCAGSLDRLGDGHPSFSPDGQWIVTDTYPDRGRMRHLLLCCPAAGQVIEVGTFFSPWRYDGPQRCDLHPRWSADGQMISIDSAHGGSRRTYIIDVRRVMNHA